VEELKPHEYTSNDKVIRNNLNLRRGAGNGQSIKGEAGTIPGPCRLCVYCSVGECWRKMILTTSAELYCGPEWVFALPSRQRRCPGNAIEPRANNSMGRELAGQFLRNGNRSPMLADWSQVSVSDVDVYSGYVYAG